jgi:hypothetical protein
MFFPTPLIVLFAGFHDPTVLFF